MILGPNDILNPINIGEDIFNSLRLVEAAGLGDLDSVKQLFQTKWDSISPINKGLALKQASKNGKLDVVSFLLGTKTIFSPYFTERAFEEAVSGGHVNVAGYLLSTCKDQICFPCKNIAFQIALNNTPTGSKPSPIVQYLLARIGNDVEPAIALGAAVACKKTDLAIELAIEHPELRNSPHESQKVNSFLIKFDQFVLGKTFPKVPKELIQKIISFLPANQESVEKADYPIYPL